MTDRLDTAIANTVDQRTPAGSRKGKERAQSARGSMDEAAGDPVRNTVAESEMNSWFIDQCRSPCLQHFEQTGEKLKDTNTAIVDLSKSLEQCLKNQDVNLALDGLSALLDILQEHATTYDDEVKRVRQVKSEQVKVLDGLRAAQNTLNEEQSQLSSQASEVQRLQDLMKVKDDELRLQNGREQKYMDLLSKAISKDDAPASRTRNESRQSMRERTVETPGRELPVFDTRKRMHHQISPRSDLSRVSPSEARSGARRRSENEVMPSHSGRRLFEGDEPHQSRHTQQTAEADLSRSRRGDSGGVFDPVFDSNLARGVDPSGLGLSSQSVLTSRALDKSQHRSMPSLREAGTSRRYDSQSPQRQMGPSQMSPASVGLSTRGEFSRILDRHKLNGDCNLSPR